MQEKQWYIVKCPNGIEEKFIKELKDILCKLKDPYNLEDYFIPQNTQQKTTGRKTIIANYIFIKINLNENIETAMNRIKYVSFMLNSSLLPEKTDEETINNLKNIQKEKQENLESVIQIDDEVEFLEGDFKGLGFKGLVKSIDEEKQLATIEIRILGSGIATVLPFTAIKVINKEEVL